MPDGRWGGAVHAGRHAAGVAVDFPVVLLPETAIQNTTSGTVRYYALAVRKDGTHMTALAAVLAEARAAGNEMIREIPTVIREDKRYRLLIDGLDDLLKRALDTPLGVEETVAVELPGSKESPPRTTGRR